MKYALEYFDRALQQSVVCEIEADTVKKAISATNKILEGKDYSAPDLYESEEMEV